MYIRIGSGTTGTFTNYTNYYGISNGAINIQSNFDGNTHSMTANFSLVDPPTVPSSLQIVEIYHDEAATAAKIVFSGVIKEVSRRIVGAHDAPSLTVFNGAQIDLIAESWETASGSRGELILYESYFSKTVNYIIKDIVTKYMPHISTSYIVEANGITLEKVVLANRTPTDAIVDLCKLAGIAWAIAPVKIAAANGYAGTIYLFTPSMTELPSPITITQNTDASDNQHRSIELEVASNLEEIINDVYLKAKSIKSDLVQETIDVNGWEGTYPLEHTPFGVGNMLIVNDEFSADTATPPDTSLWAYAGYVGLSKNMYVADGRLQMLKTDYTKSAAIISKKLYATKQPLKVRNLEISLREFLSGHYYAFGIHTGTVQTTPDTSTLALGIKLGWLDSTHAQIYLVKSGVATVIGTLGDFTVDITGNNDEVPYQFILKLFTTSNLAAFNNVHGWPTTSDIEYQIWVNGGEYGDLSEPATRLLTSGTLSTDTFPKYAAFSPAITSGGVVGSVVQGQVALEPEIIAYLDEAAWISKIEEVNSQYVMTCPRVNWKKFDLRGQAVVLYGLAGGRGSATDPQPTEYQTTIVAHTDTTFTVNSIGSLPEGGVFRARLIWRRLEVGTQETNDYVTHLIVTPDDVKPTVQFYADEVPIGRIHIYYCANKVQNVRVTNVTNVSSTASSSGIPHDAGYRKKFEEVDESIVTLNDMLSYGSEYVQQNINSLIKGTVETNTHLTDGKFIYAGMTQPVDIKIGKETFTTNTYISGVSATDVGAYIFTMNLSLGGLATFFRDRFIAKMRAIYSSGLVIDDTQEDKPFYEVQREVNGTNPVKAITSTVGSPVLFYTEFTSDGVYLEWTRSTYATKTEVRTDRLPGSTGKGLLYSGTATEFSIPFADVTRRNYVFYLYDIQSIDGVDVYSTVPTVCTLDNKAPVPAPFADVQVSAKGFITITPALPYSYDLTKRVFVVSNQQLNDTDLKEYLTSNKVDLYFELAPHNYLFEATNTIKITAYDKALYVYHFDLDSYYALDTRYTHFDRIIQTNTVCLPPMTPYNLPRIFWDKTTDSTLQDNQLKVQLTREINTQYGEPEVFHMQLHSEETFPTPIAKILPGVWVDFANDGGVYTPTGEVVVGDIGKLLIIRSTFIVTVDDVPSTKNWYVARTISKVNYYGEINGGIYDRIVLEGGIIKDVGWYDCEVWEKWYDNCDGGYANFNAGLDTLSVLSDKYSYTHTINEEFVGYGVVYAVNKYGFTDPTTPCYMTTSPTVISNEQADKVSAFSITKEEYANLDGVSMVYVCFNWSAPAPIDASFSHVAVFMGFDIEAGEGEGGEAGGGINWTPVGEFYDVGQPFITPATGRDVHFACVSVNQNGWYDPLWYSLGYYLQVDTTLVPEDLPPTQPSSVVAEYLDGGLIQIIWVHSPEPDVKGYIVHRRKAATSVGLDIAVWEDPPVRIQSTGTYYQIIPDEADPTTKTWWYQFKVQAYDNKTDEAGALLAVSSNKVQGYTKDVYDPAPALQGLSVGKTARTEGGVTYIDFAVDIDLPADEDMVNYGGCWIGEVVSVEGALTKVDLHKKIAPNDDEALCTYAAAENVTIKFRAYPTNEMGIADFRYSNTNYLESIEYNLNPTDNISLLAPELNVMADLDNINIRVDFPDMSAHPGIIKGVDFYVNDENVAGTAQKVMSVAVGQLVAGSTDYFLQEMDSGILRGAIAQGKITNISAFAYGVNYYWFAKYTTHFLDLESPMSASEAAMFLNPAFTGDPSNPVTACASFTPSTSMVCDFVRDCQIGKVQANWYTPNVNGTTVFKVLIEIATTPFSGTYECLYQMEHTATTGAGRALISGITFQGPIYCRIKYYNNTSTGVQESTWYGRKADSTSLQIFYSGNSTTLDSAFLPGSNIVIGDFVEKDGNDTPELPVAYDGSTNVNQFWNIYVEASNASSLLVDEVRAYGTATWSAGNTQLTVASITGVLTTPTDWTGLAFQWYPGGTNAKRPLGGFVVNAFQVGSEWRINLNVCPGDAQTSIAFNIITPIWMRTLSAVNKVYHKNLCPAWDDRSASPYMKKDIDYYCYNMPFNSGETVYIRARAHNGYGWGSWCTTVHKVVPAVVANTVSQTASYRSGTAPTGSFSSVSGTWTAGNNDSRQYNLTFSYPQDATVKPDCFVVLIGEGNNSYLSFNNATSPRIVFPATTTATGNWDLPITGLKPNLLYCFRVLAGKTVESDTILATTNIGAVNNTQYTTVDNLILQPRAGTTGIVEVQDGYGVTSWLHCRGALYNGPGWYGGMKIAGSSDGDTTISAPGTGQVVIDAEALYLLSSSYLIPLRLGGYYLWVDGSGRLRIKLTPAPGSDTDGTIVGTQS